MKIRRFDLDSFFLLAEKARRPFHDRYLAMYSNAWDGIVTDPVLMTVPFDDHVVHRGDGVFESLKCVNGAVYNMNAHLERLGRSAEALDLEPAGNMDEIGALVLETARAGGRRNCSIRVLVSRGPGSLGVSPADCPQTGLYVVAAVLKEPFMNTHPEGARVISSSIPVKRPEYARVKCCNYLPNVLMKKEALEREADFAAGFDDEGLLAEGATENMGIVTKDGRLLFPRLDGILRGTTMVRVLELAQELVCSGRLAAAEYSDITKKDMKEADEMLVVGTTLDVVAVKEFDGETIGAGQPGKIHSQLSGLLRRDIRSNSSMRTAVFE
ncbi:MAG: aminotransferase class IV [Kiritimatiellia bacterium]